MIKTLILFICACISVFYLSACNLFKDGEEISWSKVDNAAVVLKLAAQTTTYGVCYKNQDLAPIFKAVGEGLKIVSGSTSEESFEPEQIKAYINSLLKDYGTLGTQVNSALSVIIERYEALVNANKDKFTDSVKMCSIFIKAIGDGFIVGSDINSASANDKAKTLEEARAEAMKALNDLDLSMAK